MESYLIPISAAIVIFPFIALVLTMPYILSQYSKYGSIPFTRTLIVYSFILYLLCAYFLVILPLPDISSVLSLKTPIMQLIPFKFIADIILKTPFNLFDLSTYIQTLKNPAVYTVLFNVVLMLPFGVYLRKYFNKKWWEVIMYTFLLSLFFEVTQLSGLYGVYPRAYRLFDVDDLIVNTFGGLLGYFITPLVCFFLPSREELDKYSYIKGKRVSFTRRICALMIDFIVINVLALVLNLFKINIYNELFTIFILIYFIVFTIFTGGRTIGKYMLKMKVISIEGKKATWQYALRYLILYFLFFTPIILSNLASWISNDSISNIINMLVLMISFVIFIKSIFDILRKKEIYFYEKISKTKVVSTIVIKEEKENIEETEKIKEETT